MTDLNQTLIDVSLNEDKQINTPNKKENKDDDTSFPVIDVKEYLQRNKQGPYT